MEDTTKPAASPDLDRAIVDSQERAAARTRQAEAEAAKEAEKKTASSVVTQRVDGNAYLPNNTGTKSFVVDDGNLEVFVDNCIDESEAIRAKCLALNQSPNSLRHRVRLAEPPKQPGKSSGSKSIHKNRQLADAS